MVWQTSFRDSCFIFRLFSIKPSLPKGSRQGMDLRFNSLQVPKQATPINAQASVSSGFLLLPHLVAAFAA